jgi:outer membrane protein OmpA-like peptidoglycan-associated protein
MQTSFSRVLLGTTIVLANAVFTAYAQTELSNKKVVPIVSTKSNTEFSPTISADGRKMIFESNADKKKGWQLFETNQDSLGNWSNPVPLKSINDKCQFLAGPSLSYDGNTLYYTAFIEDVSQSEDIYYSKRLGSSSWSEPIVLGAPVNTDDNYEGFPSISADGTTLYFIRQNNDNAIDKKSKQDCFSIFVSKILPDGKWGEPTLLPAPINLGCERDPRIMADGHTLIFSSIRTENVGKYDLFQSTRQSDGTWSEPVSMKFVNSPENDQSPCISASGDLMFFYSNDDIYSILIPDEYRQMINTVFRGKVLADKTLSPESTEIAVVDLNEKRSFQTKNNDADGEFSIVLSTGSKYSIIFDNKKYLPDTFRIDLSNQKSYQMIQKEIILQSSYKADLVVIDKDLRSNVTAWVNLVQEGQAIYRDSVIASNKSYSVAIKSGDYSYEAIKKGYVNSRVKVNFADLRQRKSRDIVIEMLREKVPFRMNAVNVASKQKANVKVYYKNQTVDELIVASASETVLLRKGDQYQVVAGSEEGFFFSSTVITAGANGETTGELKIVPIEENGLVTLDNITFETNSAELRTSSAFELDMVVELMKVNPKLTIEIAAHTDDVGDELNNLTLSNKRAASSLEYLKKKGVNKERLIPKGYGESKPLAPNDTEDGRAKNRRVELRVLKMS